MAMPAEHEFDAARIVSAVTHLTCRNLDLGGGPVQLADFELLDDLGQRAGLLEVTSTVAKQRAAFQGAVRSKTWTFPELQYCWAVWTRPDVQVNDFHAVLPGELGKLEAAGLVEDLLDGPRTRLPGSVVRLGITGLATWHRVQAGEEALVDVQHQPVAGFYSIAAVTPAVQSAIDRLDNQEKLHYAAPGIGELFVWLEDGFAPAALQLGEVAAFADQVRSVPPPVLPHGITGVWAATRSPSRTRPASALWHSRGTRWRRIPPPTVALETSA